MNHWQVSSIASDRHQSQRVNTFQMGDMTHHHQHAMRNGMSMERKMDAPVRGQQQKTILVPYNLSQLLFVYSMVT